MKLTNSFSSFGRLYKFTGPHRRDFFWGTVFSVLKKLFDIAPEILIGVVIDVVVNREQSFLARFGVVDALQQLYLLSGLTLLIWVCESLCEYVLIMRWRSFAQSLQHDFRVGAYSHLQGLDMAYFEDQSTGDMVSILNDDINQLERFFNDGMNQLIQIMVSTVVIGAVFLVLSPTVAVFALLPMPFIFLGAFYFQKKSAPLYADVREQAGLLGARLQNNISGIATIRSFATEDFEARRIAEDSTSYVEANRRAIQLSARFNPIIRMGVLFGFLATFVVGGILTLKGQLNVGSYGVLVFLTQRLLWPFRDLATIVDLFERAMASADRVLNLLGVPQRLEIKKNKINWTQSLAVEFKGLSFAYENRVPVLKNIDLNVPAGKTVAIVGPTGSGKSTVTKLLLRFYRATGGQILVGGLDIETLDPQQLRQQVGLVSQDVFLFDGSILENIRYGRPDATREEVSAAARKAFADEFIDRFPEGLDTLIGERGQKLSGGQRQRLSIARVILKDPPILILDEATSSVDNETESVIQKSLTEISKNRTTISIAHRLSTITHADDIYVLAGGEIIERGRHHDLLRQNKTYSQLWTLQVR